MTPSIGGRNTTNVGLSDHHLTMLDHHLRDTPTCMTGRIVKPVEAPGRSGLQYTYLYCLHRYFINSVVAIQLFDVLACHTIKSDSSQGAPAVP